MISIKSPAQIEAMRASGALLGLTHKKIAEAVKPGVTTHEMNELAEEIIRSGGGTPAFKGYNGFPFSICASVNHEVVHGFPNKNKLQQGDIFSVDIGVKLEGMITDSANTIAVGPVSPEAERLIEVTRTSFFKGIAFARVGHRLSDISHAIGQYAEDAGYGVVRALCGHGVGEKLHEDPEIPNFGVPGRGVRLAAGMTLAIEPMINQGTWRVKTLENDWTVVTLDGRLSAHYEHTILITDGDPEILTMLPERSPE